MAYDSITSRIITLIIAIIVVGMVLVPVLNSMTDPEEEYSEPVTYTNVGQSYKDVSEGSHTLLVEVVEGEVIIHSDNEVIHTGLIYSNDAPEDLEESLATETMLVAFWWAEYEGNIYGEQFRIDRYGNTYNFMTNDGSYSPSDYLMGYEMEFADGYFTATDNPYPVIYPHFISEEGDYVCTQTPKILEDSEIFVADLPYLTTDYNYLPSGDTEHYVECLDAFCGYGTVSTLSSNIQFGVLEESESATDSSITINTDAESGYIVLNDIDFNISYDYHDDDMDSDVHVDYFTTVHNFIVPKSITVNGNGEPTANEGIVNTLLSIIPVFVILGIFVGLVVPIVSNRYKMN